MRNLWTILLVLAVFATSCASKATPTPVGLAGQIKVAGSTTVQPLAEKLAEAFSAKNPKVQIDVQGGGTAVGIKSGGEGTVDVGMASREIADSEKQQYPDMKVSVIAWDGIAAIVPPQSTVTGLTKAQVRDIFAGKITNWSQVGGSDRAIIVVSREEGSGTRTAWQDLVMGKDNPIVGTAILQNSNGAIKTTVSTTPDSIGYVSIGYLDSSVKAVAIDGVEATEANAASKKYPIVRPLIMLTKGEPTGVVKAWLDFILSAEGQQFVANEGYISVSAAK
jgi:phosphate transport system substrate-binding protein